MSDIRPDLTIVVINYKVKGLVMKLLDSVRAQVKAVSYETVVVDNGSGDGIYEDLNARFPEVAVVMNADNRGFAAAVNQGVKLARGRHVLLLNPDTELIEDAPSAMVREADANPDVGVVGCRVLNTDRTLQHSVLGFPTLCSQAAIMLKLHHVVPRLPCLKRYFLPDFDYSRTQDADQVIGAAFLMTRAGLDALGGMDERYFIWFEEVDYCRAVREKGMKVRYLATASAVHHGGRSFGQVFAPRKQAMFDASLAKYMRKWRGPAAWIAIELLWLPSMVLAWAVGLLGLKRERYA